MRICCELWQILSKIPAASLGEALSIKDFLALWKDDDPDIPILEEAKAEYAKLQ